MGQEKSRKRLGINLQKMHREKCKKVTIGETNEDHRQRKMLIK